MERKNTLLQRILRILTVVIGLTSFAFGFNLYLWHDRQVEYYNLALTAYQANDMANAIKLFDKSIAVYKIRSSGTNWQERLLYPNPDRQMAALASFHKGKAFLYSKQAKPAVLAFQEALEFNPGNLYHGRGLTDKARQQAAEEAMIIKYDLELLFKNNPGLAMQQGKGMGDNQDQDGKPVPDDDPNGKPGKGQRDSI